MKTPKKTQSIKFSDQQVARQLKLLRAISPDQRELLQTTLKQISSESNSEHVGTASDTQFLEKSSRSWWLDNLKIYVPVGTMALLLLVGGVAFYRRSNTTTLQTTNQNSSQITSANGSVDTAAAALQNDITQEDSVNQAVLTEGQAATQEVKTAAAQIGDVSNDSSF